MGRILRLEVENFRSYKGKHVIPLHDKFNAVIGSNGSGKSNFMKAISFVLGLRAAVLGSEKLKDMIFNHGRASQRLAARVTLVYLVDEDDMDVKDVEPGQELFFTRLISPSGTGSYKISIGEGNERDVTWEEYEEQLVQIKINAQCHKTFLIFQVPPPSARAIRENPNSMPPSAHPSPTAQLSAAHSGLALTHVTVPAFFLFLTPVRLLNSTTCRRLRRSPSPSSSSISPPRISLLRTTTLRRRTWRRPRRRR